MATQVEDLVLLRVDEECAKLQADVSSATVHIPTFLQLLPAPAPLPPLLSSSRRSRPLPATSAPSLACPPLTAMTRRKPRGSLGLIGTVCWQGRYLEALDYMERSLVLRRCLYGNDRSVRYSLTGRWCRRSGCWAPALRRSRECRARERGRDLRVLS